MRPLHPHPDFPSAAIRSITVAAGRRHGGELVLRYYLEGDIDAVFWPASDGDDRADGLWRHTCFEAFVGFVDAPDYCELNVAPSGRWAAYRFDGYRAGMRNAEAVLRRGDWDRPALTMEILVTLPDLAAPREWRLGLSAIIEVKDGAKSYWALAHSPGKPDFHNADCFTARLAAPTAT